MNFLIFKILFMLLVLFLLSLPFLPWKGGLTLFSLRYEKKHTWKNIAFVIETILVGSLLLCLAPLLKAFFNWFFELRRVEWLLGFLSDRTVYTADVIVVLALNFFLAFFFCCTKN